MSRNLTTAQRLFKVFYTVSIPRIHLVSAAQDNVYGTLETGNEVVDEYHSKNANIVSEQCIAKMAVIHDLGGPGVITFARPRETVEMYQAIKDHIAAWNHESEYNPNSRLIDQVLEELVLLEDFAEWLWKIARRYTPIEPIVHDDNSLAARMRKRGGGRLFKPAALPEAPKVELPLEHVRQTDVIEERSFVRRNGFR